MAHVTPAAPLEPPYYAVVFVSTRTAGDDDVYQDRAARMLDLATGQPGFLGFDSARGADGFGITVSYWRDEASIAAWRCQADHAATRAYGRAHWYDSFTVHVAKVDRTYQFRRPPEA